MEGHVKARAEGLVGSDSFGPSLIQGETAPVQVVKALGGHFWKSSLRLAMLRMLLQKEMTRAGRLWQ